MVVLLGAAIAFVLAFGSAATAQAQLSQSQVDSILGMIEAFGADASVIANVRAALTGESTGGGIAGVPANYSWNRNLTVGATGVDVRYLQIALNQDIDTRLAVAGAGSPGNETMYFGPITRNAVVRFQQKHSSEILTPLGLTAGTGFVGPSTRAKLNALAAAAPTPTPPADDDDDDDVTPTPTPVTGDEGFMNVDNISLSTHTLDLGETEVVYEVEVEAIDSDIDVRRVDVYFDLRPWLYFSEVALLRDGDVVATLSGSGGFTEVSGDWRARFTGLNEVIAEDSTSEFSIEVSVLASMAGTRESDTVEVWMPRDGIRGVDGLGLVQNAPGADLTPNTSISFADTFGEGDLNLTISDNSPEAHVFIVEENSRVNNQLLLAFDGRADDSDINVETVTVNATTSDASKPLSNVIHRARLYMNGSVVANATPGSETIVFNNIDKVISQDQTADFEVEVDFRRNSSTDYAPVVLTVDSAVVVSENQDFDQSTNTLSVGEDHDVLVEGLLAESVSHSTQSQADGKAGRYTFEITLTAVGDTFRVAESGAFSVTPSGPGSATTSAAEIVSSNATFSSANSWYRINEGQTRSFTVEVWITEVASNGLYRITLDDVAYGTSTATGAPLSPLELDAPEYRSSNLFIEA